MTKKIFLLPVLILLIASCENEPYADFIVSSQQVEVFETVYFTNTSSENAEYFEWDFGDGTWSDAINATHYYEEAGIYEVTLTAYSGNRVIDTRTVSIEVLTTSLTVIVEEYYSHKRIANASVILYSTLEDWDYEANAVVEGFTDANGVVIFDDLNPVIYFVDVWHQNYNNYDLRNDNVDWIRTGQLYRNEMNEFVAYVDEFAAVNGKTGKRTMQSKMLKIEPGIKKYVQ